MNFGEILGWVGLITAQFVPWPQLWKLWRSKERRGISLLTYVSLNTTLVLYLAHALYIRSPVFVVSQISVLVANFGILVLLLKYRNREP